MEPAFTPVSGLVGGALIGAAAVLLLLANGRIAGVSGITGGLLEPPPRGDRLWRIAFILGLWAGVAAWWVARGEAFAVELAASWTSVVAGGFLVGLGTQLANGCTSGHGICGVARLSKRSILATLVFMGAAIATVFILRHVIA